MKKILLIGGCGYIGSALYLALKNEYKIQSVDLEWFGNPEMDNLAADYNTLDQNFISEFDIVILLAGHSSFNMCRVSPISANKNNVVNFIGLLQKISKNQKFIYASSSSVYGNAKIDNVIEEYNSLYPVGYYDITKHEIDLYASLAGKNHYGLRFGTVCGPSPHLRVDVMINAMVNMALTNNEVLLFNSNTKRSILSIYDLISAVKSIINNNDNPGLYNLASFTSTAEEMALTTAQFLNVPVRKVETKEIINAKLQTSNYNYSINCDKFKEKYNFTFTSTLESIISDLKNNSITILKSDRSIYRPY